MISSMLNLAGPDLLVILTFAFVIFGFYLWMLIDCVTKETDTNQRLIWLLIIIFVPMGFAV